MMRRFLSVRFLLILVGLCSGLVSGGLGCDNAKKSADEKAAKSAPNVNTEAKKPPEPPKPAQAWYEGAFRGESRLVLGPDASRVDGTRKKSALDSPNSGESDPPGSESAQAVELKLNVVLAAGELTGEGLFGTDELSLSGISGAESVRLVLDGGSVRGTWVGQGDEKERHFKGIVRLSRTQTQAGKVSTEVYSGELLLTPAPNIIP